jgi:hypothetical protein
MDHLQANQIMRLNHHPIHGAAQPASLSFIVGGLFVQEKVQILYTPHPGSLEIPSSLGGSRDVLSLLGKRELWVAACPKS